MAAAAPTLNNIAACCMCSTDISSKPGVFLKCLHFVCLNCLNADDSTGSFTCGICRYESAVVDVKYNVILSEETLCKECSDNLVANFKCENCQDTICARCADAHKRVKLTKDHKLVQMFALDETCPIHPSLALQWYCKTCRQKSCSQCQLTLHEGHKHQPLKVHSIMQIERLVKECQSLSELFKNCKSEFYDQIDDPSLSSNNQSTSAKTILLDGVDKYADRLKRIIEENFEFEYEKSRKYLESKRSIEERCKQICRFAAISSKVIHADDVIRQALDSDVKAIDELTKDCDAFNTALITAGNDLLAKLNLDEFANWIKEVLNRVYFTIRVSDTVQCNENENADSAAAVNDEEVQITNSLIKVEAHPSPSNRVLGTSAERTSNIENCPPNLPTSNLPVLLPTVSTLISSPLASSAPENRITYCEMPKNAEFSESIRINSDAGRKRSHQQENETLLGDTGFRNDENEVAFSTTNGNGNFMDNSILRDEYLRNGAVESVSPVTDGDPTLFETMRKRIKLLPDGSKNLDLPPTLSDGRKNGSTNNHLSSFDASDNNNDLTMTSLAIDEEESSASPVLPCEWEEFCSVCESGDGQLLQCRAPNCTRVFHREDHIPFYSEEDEAANPFVCGLCQNPFNFKTLEDDVPKEKRNSQKVTLYEKKAAQRILLELYCHADSAIFHTSFHPIDFAEIREKLERVRFKRNDDSSTHSRNRQHAAENADSRTSISPVSTDSASTNVRERSSKSSTGGDGRRYSNLEEFIIDFNQLFNCCLTGYSEDSLVFQSGKAVSTLYRELLEFYLPVYMPLVDFGTGERHLTRSKRPNSRNR